MKHVKEWYNDWDNFIEIFNEVNDELIKKTEFDEDGCPVNCPCKEDYPDCYCMGYVFRIEK